MSRREKLEALLQAEPDDTFLQYALAMQFVSDGDDPGAALRLDRLLDQDPHYIPAYFQLGQLLARGGDAERSRQILARGIELAQIAGDDHAAGEMQGLLAQLVS